MRSKATLADASVFQVTVNASDVWSPSVPVNSLVFGGGQLHAGYTQGLIKASEINDLIVQPLAKARVSQAFPDSSSYTGCSKRRGSVFQKPVPISIRC